jgi:23S rRNA (cytidine1920-2'-O)/16S rRNA (cytidine1409-2'-O)-methyltransferase
VDVGRGQLAWRLRRDPRVTVMERVNARHLTRSSFPPPFHHADLVVIDCSFISLRHILPSAVELLDPSGRLLALIKPQFEAGLLEADRGRGVITDPAVHTRIIEDLAGFVRGLPNCRWRSVTESPLLGPAGNREFLACIEKAS